MKLLKSLTFGTAFLCVGLILMASAGAAESGSIIQQALNALFESDSTFHSISLLGFSLSLLGCILLIYWMLFGGSVKDSGHREN